MSSFISNNSNNIIFAIEINANDERKRKLINKFDLEEIKNYLIENINEGSGLGCKGFGKNIDIVPFENTRLYYPYENNDEIILKYGTLNEVCNKIQQDKNALINSLETINNNYHNSNKSKENFLKDFDSLKFIPSMTEEEAINYIENLPNISLDEWIETLPDLLYISNYSLSKTIPPIEIQTKIFNELLSHFFTIELVYAIADELKELNTTSVIEPIGNDIVNVEYKDIKNLLSNKPNLKYIYDVYHMLKCLCFILHDKPVNELAPFLLDSFSARIFTTNNDIEALKNIYKQGFNIQGKKAMVTQGRCHNTINNLTTKFNEIMNMNNINVPETVRVFSIPYSAFKLEKQTNKSANSKSYEEDNDNVNNVMNEIKHILRYYDYGLADAVGNDTFINDLGKTSIYPDTLSQQDAAGTTHSNNEIVVKECNIGYKITGTMNKTMNIEPLRFLDIAIVCEKMNNCENGENVFLYYASGIPYNIENYTSIPYLDSKYHSLNDNGIIKYLFGVIKGKVSQNDTVFLLSGILDISSSLRGRGKVVINKNIWYLQTNDVNTNNTIKTLLATLTKEAGDQSKIQVVENLSRNGLRSYVATVDSFFSHSFINGGVLWKGGNVEIFIPQGFEVPNFQEINKIKQMLNILNKYKYETLRTKVKNFCEKTIIIIQKIFEDNTVILPDTTKLAFVALQKFMSKPENFINIAQYNRIYNGGKFDISIHSGINDENSLIRRIINYNEISEIFILLEDEINNEFSIKLKTVINKDMKEIIERFLNDMDDVNDNDINRQSIMDLLEQMPLFYLMRNIKNIKETEFYKPKIVKNLVRYPAILVKYINELLQQVLVSKLYNFCKKYDTNDWFKDYIKQKQLSIPKKLLEDKYDDITRENIQTNSNEVDNNDYDEENQRKRQKLYGGINTIKNKKETKIRRIKMNKTKKQNRKTYKIRI